MIKLFLFSSLFLFLPGGIESCFLYGVKDSRNIKYQNELTLDFPVAKIHNKEIYDEVEKRNVTLYQYISKDGFPVYYSRNVNTGVCYDDQCKTLNITLYWNPTGRYLGFELPDNEFLSKDDHVPFTEEEYIRLNSLLSDPDLPLGEFTYNQIAAKNKAALYKVDGMSGATAKDVLEYVIQGSAYTTYTIYELVYGSSQAEVEAWTDEAMDDEYVEDILTKAPYQDKVWAIERVRGRLSELPKSKDILMDLMGTEDFGIAARCLNSLVPEDLLDEELQIQLMDNFQAFDFGMKSKTLALLKDADYLLPEVVGKLNINLPAYEVPIIAGILDIYKAKGINDRKTIASVQQIASSENKYLAKKAEEYMSNSGQ
ncbi:hypothetical protein LZF95_18935 [Algoriphagus sp. AGSA1]|uniref:hypothetical protein n=1 Tax=Algoriphagus sp. AGSA1 TaxID=2907213 RepID=UPI001F3C85BA|nr:hypothetical protein [Algoriphagus sp. AGSA1]MCE7056765.1 hypothetical protein [Algoriphagus sp. AGSA1]